MAWLTWSCAAAAVSDGAGDLQEDARVIPGMGAWVRGGLSMGKTASSQCCHLGYQTMDQTGHGISNLGRPRKPLHPRSSIADQALHTPSLTQGLASACDFGRDASAAGQSAQAAQKRAIDGLPRVGPERRTSQAAVPRTHDPLLPGEKPPPVIDADVITTVGDLPVLCDPSQLRRLTRGWPGRSASPPSPTSTPCAENNPVWAGLQGLGESMFVSVPCRATPATYLWLQFPGLRIPPPPPAGAQRDTERGTLPCLVDSPIRTHRVAARPPDAFTLRRQPGALPLMQSPGTDAVPGPLRCATPTAVTTIRAYRDVTSTHLGTGTGGLLRRPGLLRARRNQPISPVEADLDAAIPAMTPEHRSRRCGQLRPGCWTVTARTALAQPGLKTGCRRPWHAIAGAGRPPGIWLEPARRCRRDRPSRMGLNKLMRSSAPARRSAARQCPTTCTTTPGDESQTMALAISSAVARNPMGIACLAVWAMASVCACGDRCCRALTPARRVGRAWAHRVDADAVAGCTPARRDRVSSAPHAGARAVHRGRATPDRPFTDDNADDGAAALLQHVMPAARASCTGRCLPSHPVNQQRRRPLRRWSQAVCHARRDGGYVSLRNPAAPAGDGLEQAVPTELAGDVARHIGRSRAQQDCAGLALAQAPPHHHSCAPAAGEPRRRWPGHARGAPTMTATWPWNDVRLWGSGIGGDGNRRVGLAFSAWLHELGARVGMPPQPSSVRVALSARS